MARHLPIGIDEFSKLRTHPTALYIDKTEAIAQLAASMREDTPQIFLARPRRFGKTLLVSALEALFQGRKALFENTWIGQEGRWNWAEQRFPVLRLNMSIRDALTHDQLAHALRGRVQDWARDAGLTVMTDASPARMLSHLITELRRTHDKEIVVLIDEYDTPLTENMDRPDALDGIQSLMRSFYGVLKERSLCIRYTFMTGITRIALAGLFSGDNHFQDVSFSPVFNDLLGFTADELGREPDLASDFRQCAVNIGCAPTEFYELLRDYYNGYQFSHKAEAVYNPYALASCVKTLRSDESHGRWYRDHLPNGWAQSGTTALLFRLWQTGRLVADGAADDAREDALSSLQKAELDMARPSRNVLLYHTGYLTLKPNGRGGHYLDFPNQEVSVTFGEALARWQRLRVHDWHADGQAVGYLIRDALLAGDKEALKGHIDDFMQRFPYPGHALPAQAKWIYNYEMHYRGILFCLLQATGLSVQIEGSTARGRTDIVIQEAHKIFVLECKVNGSAAQALRQVWDKGYVDLYRTSGQPVTAFGLNFSTGQRTITDVAQWELGRYDVAKRRWDEEPFGQRCPLTQLSQMDDRARARIICGYGD